MVADIASIRSVLKGIEGLPAPVLSRHVEKVLDATDDPAVWVWAMVEAEAGSSAANGHHPGAVARPAHQIEALGEDRRGEGKAHHLRRAARRPRLRRTG